MGYNVRVVKSTARIPAANLETAYQVMCALNTTHDNQKRGGSWSGGEQTGRWFPWVDENYPETCPDARAVLEQLGFETQYDTNGDLLLTHYDSKTGQEDLFLAAIQNLALGRIHWMGEDGETYTTDFLGHTVVDEPPVALIGHAD